MTLFLFIGLVAAFTLRTLTQWRAGFALMVLVAAVQDPVRKLVPGTPGWLALATAPIFLAAVATMLMVMPQVWRRFTVQFPSIGKNLVALMVLSIPAALISASYGPGSWMLTVVGAFSYSIIFLAVMAGYFYPRHPEDVRRLLAVYCAAHGVMLTGGIFEYLGWFKGWVVIGDEALGYSWIRYGSGYIVDIVSGFYRSGDVMGWHAAAVATLSIVLALSGKRTSRWLWLLLSAMALVALILCGRRKMVYMLPVFALALIWIYWQAGRAGKVWSIVGLLILPLASVWFVGDRLAEDTAQIRYYRETSDETLDRFQVHGFQSLVDTYRQSGFFGEGLGTATPGSHHLKVARPRVWQESGPSRILVELGVLGALGFLAVVVAIVLSVWRVTREQLRARSPHAHYAAGLVAFFLANVGSLTVSGQILADPFIAAFLGLMTGLVLSFARQTASARAETAPPVASPMPLQVRRTVP
jgi:hypothetical protein